MLAPASVPLDERGRHYSRMPDHVHAGVERVEVTSNRSTGGRP